MSQSGARGWWVAAIALLAVQAGAAAYLHKSRSAKKPPAATLGSAAGGTAARTSDTRVAKVADAAATRSAATAAPAKADATSASATAPASDAGAASGAAAAGSGSGTSAASSAVAAATHAKTKPARVASRRTNGRRRVVRRPPSKKMALAPKPGVVRVVATPPATLTVDGKRRGVTPQRLELSSGPHTIVLEGAGLRTHRSTITVKAGLERDMHVQLQRVPAKVAVAPKPKPKPKPNPAVTKPVTPPKPAMPKRVPRLRLPGKLVVPAFKGGKRSKVARVVCIAVERVVAKAIGRSAAGTTAALRAYLRRSTSDGDTITLYPRVMGYLIGDALIKGRSNVGATLVAYQKSGRMASLNSANWRP